MKRFALLSVAALAFGLVGATPSVAGPINLVTNGPSTPLAFEWRLEALLEWSNRWLEHQPWRCN